MSEAKSRTEGRDIEQGTFNPDEICSFLAFHGLPRRIAVAIFNRGASKEQRTPNKI